MSEAETRDRPTRTTDTSDSRMKWLSGFVSLVGTWIFISAFVYPEMSVAGYWNNLIIGAAIFPIARYNYDRMSNGMATSVGGTAFVALLGLWMILVPFLLTVGMAFWSDIVAGIVIAIIAGYNAYTSRSERTQAPAGTA